MCIGASKSCVLVGPYLVAFVTLYLRRIVLLALIVVIVRTNVGDFLSELICDFVRVNGEKRII